MMPPPPSPSFRCLSSLELLPCLPASLFTSADQRLVFCQPGRVPIRSFFPLLNVDNFLSTACGVWALSVLLLLILVWLWLMRLARHLNRCPCKGLILDGVDWEDPLEGGQIRILSWSDIASWQMLKPRAICCSTVSLLQICSLDYISLLVLSPCCPPVSLSMYNGLKWVESVYHIQTWFGVIMVRNALVQRSKASEVINDFHLIFLLLVFWLLWPPFTKSDHACFVLLVTRQYWRVVLWTEAWHSSWSIWKIDSDIWFCAWI